MDGALCLVQAGSGTPKKLEEVLETFFYRMPDDRLSKEAAKIL